jgi:hypothetical protein
MDLLQLSVAQGPAGNLTPAKDNSTERIDGIVALIMDIGRAMVATCQAVHPDVAGSNAAETASRELLAEAASVLVRGAGSSQISQRWFARPRCGFPDSPKLRWPAFRRTWQ